MNKLLLLTPLLILIPQFASASACVPTSSGTDTVTYATPTTGCTYTVPAYETLTVTVNGAGGGGGSGGGMYPDYDIYIYFGNNGTSSESSSFGSVVAGGGGGGYYGGYYYAVSSDNNPPAKSPAGANGGGTIVGGGASGGAGGDGLITATYETNWFAGGNGGNGGQSSETFSSGALSVGSVISIVVGAGGAGVAGISTPNGYVSGASGAGSNGSVTISWTTSNCPTPITTTSDGWGFNLFANLLNVVVNAVSLNFCVSNTSSNHYFIPAKTTAELQSFYNAANAGNLSGVSVFAP